jgi:shikimate dehydrogenase
LHAAALTGVGLEGGYSLYPLTPQAVEAGDLQKLCEAMRSGEIHGLNVTIPYKQVVLPLLDELTSVASATGAVNTIYRQNGRLVGDNTDVEGFTVDLRRNLEETGQSWGQNHLALVLGAGGSARAAVYALAVAGWGVWIAARRLEQARALIEFYGGVSITQARLSAMPLDARRLQVLLSERPIDLIVNTTPLGMAPREEASPWPDEISLPLGAFLYDLIYNPPETVLLKAARSVGLRSANGLGMLIEQAALAFERWTGRTPPLQLMAQAVQ